MEKREIKKKKRFVPIFIFFVILFISYLLLNTVGLQKARVFLNEKGIIYETFTVSFDEGIPSFFVEELSLKLEGFEKNGKKRFEIVSSDADFEIILLEEGLYSSFLLPVGHFYWIENKILTEELNILDIYVPEGYGLLFEDKKVFESDDLVADLKGLEGDAVGFVPIESLNYELQLLYLDEKYFLEDGEGIISWGVGIKDVSSPNFLYDIISENISELNKPFNLEDVLKVNMSGVTALSRNLAFKIEKEGDYTYPAGLIADFLGDADIVHTSNEVSFVPNCKPEASMSFCSHPNYIQTLEAAGINVVELTGNHNNDFGSKYNAETIEMYKERGWDYYGGGLNDEDASEILYIDKKDSKIAFIGYNYYDSIYDFKHNLAGPNSAGANSFSFEKMELDIKKAKEDGAVAIVTFQFEECYSYPPSDVVYPICYKPLSNPDQKEVFRTAIDYGADIVVGSQAHQPQTYEIYENKLIFYGTGNLFFDQIYWIGTRQGMVLSHYIYNGTVIQSKINTTLYDDDMRPYITFDEDRLFLLNLLKDARYWE